MKKKKLFGSIATVCIAATALISLGVSYSWIKREFAPEFDGSNLTVETSGSLAIKMYHDPNAYNIVDLNDVLSLGNFKLKQVSNATGLSSDFFGINYNAATGDATLRYLQAAGNEPDDYQLLGTNNGYIECRFLITCTTTIQDYSSYFIFLDSSPGACKIDFPTGQGLTADGDDLREAIRISLTAEDLNKNYLFRKTAYYTDTNGVKHVKKHRGANPAIVNGARVANGVSIYDSDGLEGLNESAYVETDQIHDFADFDGGIVNGDESTFDDTKALFSMIDGARWVTMRIWLEGYDSNTVDDISGGKVNVKLTFKMAKRPTTTPSSN